MQRKSITQTLHFDPIVDLIFMGEDWQDITFRKF